MPDQFESDNDNTQRRIRQQRVVIHTNFGSLSIGRNQTTAITETGDLISDDAQHIITIDGQIINDPTQLIGQCKCGRFLTVLTFGYCVLCFQVRCPQCSIFDNEIGNWLCLDCAAAVKKARFWQGVREFFTRPFRRG